LKYYNYLIEFTNLVIGICNSDDRNPNYYPQRELRDFKKVGFFKKMVKQAHTEIPFCPPQSLPYGYSDDYYLENEKLKSFFEQYYKHVNDSDDYFEEEEDEIPLDELVGFERHKFGKLHNQKRRK